MAYTDDIVIMAPTEGGLRNTMKIFKKYTERKRLSLCTEKTKILVFERERGNRKKPRKWK